MTRSATRRTIDHDEIREWAAEHGAEPASVRNTSDDGLGVLTFDVVGHGAGEEELSHVEWDEWLQAFEDNGLALVVQDHKASGEDSTFFRLVNRESVEGD